MRHTADEALIDPIQDNLEREATGHRAHAGMNEPQSLWRRGWNWWRRGALLAPGTPAGERTHSN